MTEDFSDNGDVDRDTLQELKFKLLLARVSKDDPLVEAEMLAELEALYKEKNLRPSLKVEEFITTESKRLQREIEIEITEKKHTLESLLQEKKRKEERKRKEVRQEEDKDKKGKLTRTQLIFGSKKSNYGNVMDYLDKIDRGGMHLGLDKMQKVLAKLGNPEKSFRCIHVAGTNGKGSVAAMLHSILTDARYNVGLYTSPHLQRFTERIKVGADEISDEKLVELVKSIKPYIDDEKLTYFEIATVIAFLYFKEKGVDIAIIEVGLGGRLDATNVITPLVSVITNISIEHVKYLGDTIKNITKEKAAIIKPGCYVVTGCTDESLQVITETAAKNNATLVQLPDSISLGDSVTIGKFRNMKLGLKGKFQHVNAAISVAVVEILNTLGFKIPDASITNGLKFVFWPGRFEVIRKNIIIDCAHNLDAIKELAGEVKRLRRKNVILVIGILNDKDIKGMVAEIAPLASKVIITKPNMRRACDPAIIEHEVKKYVTDVEIKKSVKDAVTYAISQDNDLILITGSCFVVGEAIDYL